MPRTATTGTLSSVRNPHVAPLAGKRSHDERAWHYLGEIFDVRPRPREKTDGG
jgi:hypothetical protein